MSHALRQAAGLTLGCGTRPKLARRGAAGELTRHDIAIRAERRLLQSLGTPAQGLFALSLHAAPLLPLTARLGMAAYAAAEAPLLQAGRGEAGGGAHYRQRPKTARLPLSRSRGSRSRGSRSRGSRSFTWACRTTGWRTRHQAARPPGPR